MKYTCEYKIFKTGNIFYTFYPTNPEDEECYIQTDRYVKRVKIFNSKKEAYLFENNIDNITYRNEVWNNFFLKLLKKKV